MTQNPPTGGGKSFIWENGDGALCIWNVVEDRQIGEILEGGDGEVSSAAFSYDGKQIVAAYSDGIIRIWDAATGRQVGDPLIGPKSGAVSAAFTSDGKRVLSVFEDGTIHIWDFAPLQDLIDGTRKQFKDCELTPEEKKRFYLE